MKKSFLKIFVLFFLVIFFSKYNISNASFIGTSPTVVATSTCSVGLSCGIVGYWTFDGKDMVRGVARDRSGSGNHGNLINISTSTFYTLGQIGQGFNFDGVDDSITVSDSNSLDSSLITISAWIKPIGKGTTPSDYLGITQKSNVLYGLAIRQDGTVLFYLPGVSNWVTTDGSKNVFDGSWHHITVTYDGLIQILYIDGILINSNPIVGSITTNSSELRIGGNADEYKGFLDDVRIYNRALSASEITQLYSSGASNKQGSSPTVTATTCSAGLSCGLVGYWTFDGKDVARGVAQDKSGNGNHGNLINISTSTFYALGKIGQGFNFDGSDDAVRASDSSSLDISDTQSVTQSAWVYSTSFAGHPQVIEKRGNYELRVNTAGNVDSTKYYSNTTRCRRTTTNPITLNKWHHIVSVAVNTNCPDIYVNGVLQSSSGTPEVANYEVIQPLGIGNRSVVNTQQWVGKLDDIRIYNRALSANEISQLYSIGTSTKQGVSPIVTATSTCSFGLSCGLIGYWTFDGKDMVRGVARDMSGSGNLANLINISTSTFYALGKIGQGFNFDFSNDAVNLSTNILANRSSFSIMMWARKNKSATGALFASRDGGPYWRVTGTAGDTLFYVERSNCTTEFTRNTVLFSDDKFHHVGVTMDSTGAYKVFKDGIQVDSATYTGWDYVCTVATDWASIGNYAASFPFGGVIDDVRIYGRDISATEVKQLYNMGK